MNVQRTPDRAKRVLSDSAPQNEDEKRQREGDEGRRRSEIDDVPPAWAERLFAAMENKLSMVDAKLTRVDEKLSALDLVQERCDDMDDHIAKNADDIVDLREDIAALRIENRELRDKLDEKADKVEVAKVTDTTLRQSMTVCRVEKAPGEKYWNHTKHALATALAGLTPADKGYDHWYKRIERAHRGKTTPGKIPVIHMKFRSWVDWDYFNNLFKGDQKPDNPDGIQFYEKYSEHTGERRKKALALRYDIRKENKAIKAYIKYPADLHVKKPGEQKYTCVAKF